MENKYTMLYKKKYGPFACMSVWELKAPYKTMEEVYKEAIEKNKTWKEILSFKGYKKGVLF